MIRSRLFLPLVMVLNLTLAASAQSLVSTSGNTASHTNVSMSWSIGEPIVGSGNTAAYSFIAGFHQPLPLTITAVINDPERSFRVFPNPARDRVIIQRPVPGDYELIIYDITGKSIEKSTWLPQETEKEIATMEWAAGVYVIKVFEKGKAVNETRLLKL